MRAPCRGCPGACRFRQDHSFSLEHALGGFRLLRSGQTRRWPRPRTVPPGSFSNSLQQIFLPLSVRGCEKCGCPAQLRLDPICDIQCGADSKHLADFFIHRELRFMARTYADFLLNRQTVAVLVGMGLCGTPPEWSCRPSPADSILHRRRSDTGSVVRASVIGSTTPVRLRPVAQNTFSLPEVSAPYATYS